MGPKRDAFATDRSLVADEVPLHAIEANENCGCRNLIERGSHPGV
jgi:hypothetical protein